MVDEGRVSNEDLDAAALAAEDHSAEDNQDVDQDAPKLKDEPQDNRERSQLGRRVSDMERNISDFMSEVRETLADLKEPRRDRFEDFDRREPVEERRSEFDLDEPLTYKDLLKWEEQKQIKEDKYVSDYRAMIGAIGKATDRELHEAIVKEMGDNFNVKHSDSGAGDARVNYAEAKAAVYERMAKTNNPFKRGEGNSEEDHLGGPVQDPNRRPQKTPKLKLDPYAAEFVRRTGMSDEDINEALEGESPAYLKR